MFNWANKRVGVTGASGMVGRSVVNLLVNNGAEVVRMDLMDYSPSEGEFRKVDLRFFDSVLGATADLDVLICAAGIKGSPDACLTRPADFFVPMAQLNLNSLDAAVKNEIANVVYMSSVGVYQPAERFIESELWNGFPSPNDWYGGWAKRLGEIQISAYQAQNTQTRFHTIRPANVYGPFDNFVPPGSMVVPSLIRKAFESDDGKLHVLGDGRARRDFVYAADVARAALFVVEHGIEAPVNIGSGDATSIAELSELVVKCVRPELEIVYSETAVGGDNVRVMDMSRLREAGFLHEWPLAKGLAETVSWFANNRHLVDRRFNPFEE